MKKEASEIFSPVFYLWRIPIVLNNMNMGAGGGRGQLPVQERNNCKLPC